MSAISRENSRTDKENATMLSAVSDVLEMEQLCGEIAARLTRTGQKKDRVGAIFDVFRVEGRPTITRNRALEFLEGKARRIDSWEKDHAREALAALKRAEQEREDRKHLDWLARTLAAYRAAPDPDLRRPEAAALERALSEMGLLDRVVGTADASENRDH